MSGKASRVEPGQELLMSDDWTAEDVPYRIPLEPADTTDYIHGWCKEAKNKSDKNKDDKNEDDKKKDDEDKDDKNEDDKDEDDKDKKKCGRHITNINDLLRLQDLGVGSMKEILKEIWNKGAFEETVTDPDILKVLDVSSSYVTCDGKLLRGYKYIYRSGHPRPNCTGERWASDFLLKLLFRYNDHLKEVNRINLDHIHDYFGGPMIRNGYEESLNLYPYEVWEKLNDGQSITIVHKVRKDMPKK